MRQLRRLARRRAQRKRPLPRWQQFLLDVSVFAVVAALLAGGGWAIGRSSALVAWTSSITQQTVELLSEHGFVVSEAFTEGRERTSLREIAEILENYEMQSILLIDTVAVKNQLEALPWVRSAAVKRSFPNELRIVLDEYQPAARWQSAESEMLIDAEGAIITENTSGRFARLPVVAGDGVREQLAEFWSLLETDRGLAAKVRSATLIGGRRWDLQLDDDVIVHLPTKAPDDAFRRLAKLDRDQAILSRAVAKVDLRSEDWIVVTPVEDGDPSIVGGQPA